MPNKVTYTITTADGKEHQVSKENVDKYGIQSYADAYKGATIRMRDAQKGDYDIPLQHFDNARKQGLHAFSLEHMPVQKQAASKPTPTSSVTTTATSQDIVQSPRPQSQKDRPMTAVEKASMISNVGNIVNTTQAGLQRTKNMMTYAKSKAGLHVEPVKLGKKNNVVETAKQYNPKTGKMQSHYLTEAGNEYDDKTQADIEQAAIDDQKRRELDPVQSQLEDAYSERDRLEEAVSARRKELEDEYNNRPWYQRILTEMGKASHSNVDPAAISTDPEHMGFAQDEQYMQLMSAIRKNHQTIQTLEDKKNGQMNSFWHSLGTTLTNGYIFADGLPEMRDATAILNAQKHIDSINRKRKTGQALTKEEAAAEAVLRNTQVDNVVQGTYGSEYGAWARAGRGTAYSADFMKDFLLFPNAANIAKGVAGKVAGIGGKYLAKTAGETAVKATAKTIARATLKATGVVVGAHTAGAVISNTTGIGRTVAKMGQLSAGDVSMDKNGNYKMENQQDLMSAFAEAEREQARENGSEMFGEFIPGGKVLSAAGKKALSKIGLGRISNILTSIGNKAWYKNYTNLLSKGGYNGIPGEALEEYEGMFFDTITGHADEAVRDFTDPKQQVDIWLGCAAMGAFMGAIPMANHIQGYYRYKHSMDRADRTAEFRLTPQKWQPLKEQIDQTDNGNMTGFVVGNILNNKSLETQEKEAAMNYVRNLTKFRGFNIAQVNNADDEAKDTQIESRQQNEAYSMGYNLQDEKELNNTAILYDEAKKQATKATGWDEDTLESMIGEDGGVSTLAYMKHSDEFNDGQLQAFIDYANARAAYNGMIQRVKDDIDTKVHESNLEVEQRTNLNTGAIHPATMKVDDRQVYIVNGNVVMLPDGSGVNHEHSDDFVVLRDAKTGKLEQADPSAISKVDAPINPQEEKEAAADNIRQTFAQQQADKIDGKLEFKQGDTYSIIDKEDGAQHSLSIIGDAINEKTGQVNPEMVLVDIDGAQQPILLPKEQVQQQVDEARRAAVAATQVVENAPTTNTNNTYSINDEVTLSDENGNTVRGSITAPENEDGKFEVYTEQPINGKKVNLFSAEELDAMTKAPTDVAENTTTQQPQQQEETENSVEKEAPQQQTTALERIPKDESGQPLYEQTDPETAWDAIVEQTEGNTSMAQTVADDMVSDLEAGVKKAEKTKTKSGGSIAEKIAAEKERLAVIEQAKATLAHWRKIAAVNRMREAAIQAEEQRKADEVARVRKEQEEKERVEQEEAERIKPKNVVKKLGDKMKNFANILLRANDENISFAELVDSNGVDAFKWLNANGVISPTQYKSAFDSKGNITAEAKNDIKGIMYQSIFEGGNTQLEEMFNALPAKAQKAILATAYRDYDSPQSERMIEDIQDSIMAYYALSHDSMFMNAKNHKEARIAVEAWRRQLAFDDVTGESYLPAEKYSNFALLLATMYKGDNQSLTQGTFNKMYDLIQGTQEETLFEQPDNTPRSLAQAIKETLNIEYNGQQGSNVLAGDSSASQEERTGSNGDATPRGRSEDINGAEANQGGTERDTGRSGSEQSSGGSQEEVAAENSHLTKKEAADFIAQMELGADVAQEIPLTIENWDKEFGEDGIVSTPIGDVKMGENQFAKLMRAGRNGKLGMLKPTLEYPDAIVEENSKAKEGTHTERPSSFIFIKSFRKTDGTRYYYFTSITVSVDGKEVVVSNQEKSRNRILRLLMEGSVVWRTPKDATTSSAEKQGLDYAHPDKAEGETKGSVITPQNTPSVGKDSKQSDTKQEKSEETAKKDAVSEDLFAKAERVAEEDKAKRTRKKEEAKVDTNPTEAQKEAGNYKKGHIKVDGFNVTIEQPKGSVRRGKDANGKEWETEMHNTYGYIRGTESVDGDHIDIFLSDNPTEGNVFVVDQVNKDGSFDEHKVMYGFSDMESARKAYLSNYEEGWQGLGNITEVSKEEFKKWIDRSKRKTKPFAEYSSVKTEGDVNVQHPIEDKGNKRLVSNERYEELKKRMRSKLGQLNLGVDPEMLAIGAEMAVYHIENGARAFGAYAKEMISDLGDAIRPYLKAFYNGARDLPEMVELSKEMSPYDEVSRFDVATIGNEGEQLTPSAIETAEQINNEATVEFNAKQEQSNTNELEDVDNDAYSITKQHNNKKDVDIWVVRGKERTDKDVYTQRKQVAKEHNGYYSSFRGVNGFVFKTAEEAHAFADAIFNTQSEENPAHNSEKVHKAIDAYEDAQEKFDNLFSLLVKEKESKPFDTREWREVNRTKEELKDVLLQLNTKELGELLKQVSGKDTEYVIKNVLDIVNREEHRLIAFNAILDKQSYITPEYKEGEKAIPVSEFVETDKKRAEIYTILTGVFHDKGYVVGTDAYLLLARKEDYDKSLEGKVTNKKGEVINGKYPNWRAVVNSGKQGKSWGVNLEELHAFTRGVLTKLKTEKANPSIKKDAKIAFKTADGKIILCYANALDKALQGAKSIGAKSFFDNDDVFAITQTPKGYVICPMLNQDQNIDDNSFAYIPRVSELQHSTETLSNDTEAKRLATDGLKIHQAKKSQKESKDSNVFLSHKEYIEKELVSALKQTKYKTLEEWEDKDTENYAQKYDDILETYEDYVRDLADDEKLQAIYDKSSVKTQKEIREYLTDADLDYHEFINTSPKRLRIQDRLTRKSKYAKGEFSDGTIVSGEVVRWSPTSLTVNSRGTLYTISANKVLEQSNEPMNADGHEYQENGPLQYSTEDLTNNTTAKQLATDTILSALNKAGIEVVRATDEQAQELLANTHATSLRTPQGTIYGWAVDGKIYLTEAGINPDTPIHEYTHLWAEAMKTKNKKGWNSIKALLKETPVWNEVVADPNYSNIMNDEDAVASEVLSRISGRENAARMESEAQKVIDEDKDVFEKAKSVTLLNRIKRALDMFWKWVGKELFKIKKFGSIDEVTDRVLYDLVNGTDLNGVRSGNNDDIRYRDFDEEVNEQFNRELAGLTEENADTKIFNLGSPSSILLSAGVEDKPMKLYGNKVIKKMKKHSFALEELQDLPKAVANPIAVFNNYQREGNRTILTELRSQGKNIMVAITLGKNGVDVDFNIVSSVFGKRESNVVDWINKGYLTYINKEKALNYLYFSESSISEATDNVGQEDSTNLYLSAPIAEAAENSELSSAAKIVKDFVNPNIDEEKLREGYGSYTNTELSLINDPVAKMLGKSNRSKEDHKAFAERERQRMISRISELADRLHLDNIEAVTDSNSLQGKKAKSKGFYSKNSGKITIVIPNHASVEDVEKTLLHEAVAHYGLRKLFGEHFETFLDNVYQNVEPEIRRIITSQAANNNWDFRTATEEYLAGLAERTDFERVHYAIWNKIKSLFLKMLHSIGFEGWSATELSDNELRYLLWRSYENLKEPGRYRSILGEAEDIAKQNGLKVGNYDQKKTNSSNVAERGILYREDDSKEKERVNAREKYEQRINRAMFQTQEALQDSMLGLKEAMNAITKAEGKNVNIEDIDGYENAYLGENRLSSVNNAEADAFAHLLFKPMLAEVSKICKNAQERSELVDYMMAKHGLERNAIMRKRAIEDILNNEKLSDAQKSARAGLAEYRDYAGLTALTGKDNVTEAEVDAETMVSEYESTHDTTNLWDKVNAVNAAILSKSYECGMMDKDTYEKISDMYKYYIPLRGFDETTSEEAYAYLLHQSSAFNAPIKVAKGRSSKADDPFANMQSMAESAITQGNRNKLVKQRFFNFVLNHPSDLVSISDMWLKYDDVADEWNPVFPDNFEENDSAEDIEQKLKEFEDKMKKLAEQAPDKYKHGKETTNIPYRVVDSRDLRQHQVLVKRGGRDYILTLNGNPRAAQALNGQTNPDNDTSGAIGAILKAGEMVNRQLSAFYTTRNPDFVVSNFIRDMLFSNSIVWVKESPNYALRFHRNIARCNPAQIKVLLAKYRKGTLDMNNKLEHMFYQFMMNGGETGYANVRDIEQHKNDIRRELKRANGKLSITKAFNLLGEKLDEYNRAVENCARFAAYLTSREMGRTVERSIYDAKEISVNFNKKGSGAKFMNAVGQTKIGTASAFVSGIGRSGFVFWNAAIQGTTNFGRQFKKHPAKAFTASAIMFLLGAVIAGMGMGDGDDDADANSYWNLPEYVRRSNILFKIGDQWVSIPLPVEYRAIYGMGELMVSAMSGKEHFTGSELGKAIAGQATQVLPIDFLEGGGGVKAFVPSAVKPFAEVYSNKGWTGMPIYKDTPYNKYMPEWTKAYKSANKYLVGIAKTLNEATGGDAYTKGSVDINPAQIEYLLNGYFGGVSGTIDKLSKSAETIAGDREYDPRNFLLLNRILKNGDERTEARAINNEYMRVKEEHDALKARMKHYENDTDKGLFDYADKIDFLYNSPEFARYEIFEDYSKDIDALYQELKEANDGAEHLSIEKELTELKKEMIEEMNKTRK